MKNIIFKFITIVILSSVFGCYDYETQFEGPYSDEAGDFGPNIPREVVYVSGGNVYFATASLEDPIIIDNSGNVSIASINASHTTILFKRPNSNIQIYDVETSRVTGEVASSQNASWFDYHPNNNTIFYLIGNNLHTQGPQVLASQPLNLNDFFFINVNIQAALITANNDIIFTGRSPINTFYLVRTNGSNSSATNTYQFEYPSIFTDLRMNASESLVLGTNNLNQMIRFNPGVGSNFNFFNDSKFGVPTGNNSLYGILNDCNTISIPPNVEVPITTGTITSIDN